jgi:oligopeptide/dipeptide ABC transporter ATP-binding protein
MSSKDGKDSKESTNLFSVKNVSREFGKKRLRIFKDNRVLALNNINLEINEMDAIGIVGESGSGKTTLGRILVGLDKPTKGEVLYKGKEIRTYNVKEKKWFHHQTQMIFQNPFASLNPYRSVLDILESGFKSVGKVDKKEVRKKIIDLLSEVGMHEDALNRYPHQFSGGQRQRLVIARALSVDPKILIADEPVSALDVSIQAQVLNLLNDLRKSLGLTIVFITHDLRVANFFCDRIAVMYKGRIVEIGDSRSVLASPQHPYTRMLLDAAPSGNPDGHTKSIINQDSEETLDTVGVNGVGCNFADRCWLRKTLPDDSLCFQQAPTPRMLNGTNLVECHHSESMESSLKAIIHSDRTSDQK